MGKRGNRVNKHESVTCLMNVFADWNYFDVETKGDHLENTETKYKLELGRAWQNMAGSSFRYYMVFQSKDLNLNGAIQFDKFCELMKNL